MMQSHLPRPFLQSPLQARFHLLQRSGNVPVARAQETPLAVAVEVRCGLTGRLAASPWKSLFENFIKLTRELRQQDLLPTREMHQSGKRDEEGGWVRGGGDITSCSGVRGSTSVMCAAGDHYRPLRFIRNGSFVAHVMLLLLLPPPPPPPPPLLVSSPDNNGMAAQAANRRLT
jgi:hypothetical protein